MRNTINPYLNTFRSLVRRVLWDLKSQSWKSRKQLRVWRNKYLNQKAVIVCNGPSLLNTDFDLLDGVFTFGLNKINLLFDQNDFRPSCVVAVNPYVIDQNKNYFNTAEIPLFLDSEGITNVTPRPNVVYLHSEYSYGKFAKDCSMSICQGHTVTYVAMQLAFHMGFSEVALIGCDHNFATKGPANKVVIAGESDPNHFHKNYFGPGQSWQLPDLYESEAAYAMAKKVYDADDRLIVNSTVGGDLELFERQDLVDFVG